LVLHKINTSDH